MRYTHIFLFILLLFSDLAYAQLSVGGFPMEVNVIKSAEKKLIKMPVLNQSIIDEAIRDNQQSAGLKPFKFAHVFPVKLHAGNSGQWYSTNANYNVWKLTIESAGAKSINLIFSDFYLRDGARLYIYNEKTNDYLGAFTAQNNKVSGKFAVAPVAGDRISIQYEVPENIGTPVDFVLDRVNHDFIGILKFDRRPFNGAIAGSCNVDVNCDMGDNWNELKNSVCRLIVDGDEICTGTLVNNTAEDQKPYVLSASHCYDEWRYAETTVYTFNYESPYCAPLDGDPIHSLSGAVMKAHFDSLDFALVLMDEIPPPDFRPFYAGWDRTGNLPDSSVSIHHPVGDVKKIAFDNDKPQYATFRSSTIKNPTDGSFRILRWDDGVTEIGSSGGALFDNHQNLIGTLSGGTAACGNPIDDYFARFDMQWDFNSDSSKQLKYWLDPINSGLESLAGKNFNTEENLCKAFTNLEDKDTHGNIVLTAAGETKGYWGGSNSVGITEIMERFSLPGNATLDGISFGVGKLQMETGTNSAITIKVYSGTTHPEEVIYSKLVGIAGFAEDAMNFVVFDELVETTDTFFVGFELSNINPQDTFSIYQALRKDIESNNFLYYKQNSNWYNFKENNTQDYSMANVMELLVCNMSEITDTPIVDLPVNVLIYPNPTSSELVLESDNEIQAESISVYDLIGREMDVTIVTAETHRVRLNLNGNTTGVYFVRFNYENTFVTRKFSYVSK